MTTFDHCQRTEIQPEGWPRCGGGDHDDSDMNYHGEVGERGGGGGGGRGVSVRECGTQYRAQPTHHGSCAVTCSHWSWMLLPYTLISLLLYLLSLELDVAVAPLLSPSCFTCNHWSWMLLSYHSYLPLALPAITGAGCCCRTTLISLLLYLQSLELNVAVVPLLSPSCFTCNHWSWMLLSYHSYLPLALPAITGAGCCCRTTLISLLLYLQSLELDVAVVPLASSRTH